MQIQFLGTSASPAMPLPFCQCEVCTVARHRGGKNLRRRSSLLLNQEVLLDLGPDIVTASYAYNIPLTGITVCLQTHPHEDHFDPELIISRHPEYGSQQMTPLLLGGSQKTLSMLDVLIQRRCAYGSLFTPQTQQALQLEVVKISPYSPITLGPYHIIGYPANHATEHDALLYSITDNNAALFYGTDTAAIVEDVWHDLKARNMRYDLVVLDHTYGIGYPTSDHLATDEFIRHAHRFAQDHLKDTGRIYATHLSHEGIREHTALQEYASHYGYHIAYDGLQVTI